MYIIAIGNLADGFQFIGPFDTRALALRYIDENQPISVALITELIGPT